jgi:hypothetical protein
MAGLYIPSNKKQSKATLLEDPEPGGKAQSDPAGFL